MKFGRQVDGLDYIPTLDIWVVLSRLVTVSITLLSY